MAEGGGGAGKAVAGCSCLSMVFFMVLVVVIQFALVPLAQALPDLAALWGFLGGVGSWISQICCCLSGLGLVIGIVMLLLSGKKGDDV